MSSIIYQPSQTQSINNDPILYLYIINARHLSLRREKIKEVVKQIAQLYKYRVIPKFISTNDPVDLEPKLGEMKDKIGYDACGDADYDRLLEVLNIETLSNMFKHFDVWAQISHNVSNPNDLHLVIEDDTIIMEQNVQPFRELLEYVSKTENNIHWDLLFPGLAQPTNTNTPIILTHVASTFKIIPSKETYFMNKQAAQSLLQYYSTNKISHSLRIQLSKYIFMNKEKIGGIKAMIPNRRCTIDGSKLGFSPTTIHNNNILLYNGEYMELFTIFTKSVDEIKPLLPRVKQIYNSTKHISSADLTHMYGIILMKLENYEEAEDILQHALEQTRNSQGLLNNRCDICNNLVNLYEKLQTDVKILSKLPSKYSNYETIPLKD